ncbi:MAG TPA: diadenylate cyclase CdaA [Candidatus Cloacimonadota bacterium]|nr:diadenylate cyclase CdaA [Candidatus Cloacimonadota bacterium]HPS37827.1 diadenylate cyclase CdaA [Candidatus Cloacimonadota bacterium]
MDFLIPSFADVIDILIIAFLIYQALLIVRKSGSHQILWGLLLIFVFYFLAMVLNLRMLTTVLNTVRNYWILALVILFQPELRSFLSRLNISRNIGMTFHRKEAGSQYTPLIDAISSMSFRKIGALIVIENKRNLNEYIHGGELLDASVSTRLILTIFNTRSVLHDGAIIIRGDRIMAAKVVLPLSKKAEYVSRYGTRHLAGIGISELTDALVIIVSEQTGQISVASGGKLQTGIAFEELVQIISDASR